MRISPRKYLPAVVSVAALLGAGCGDSDDASSGGAAKVNANPVDRAFVADMIPHHEAAVQMAEIAKSRGSSAFVKQLAADIIRTQKAEIATMRARDKVLADAGITQGSLGLDKKAMGMDHDLASLNHAKQFDRAFLQMMIPHHQGAITMSDVELDRGKDADLRTVARNIIGAQRREISAMRKHLGETGGGAGHEDDAMHGSGMSG